MVQTGYDKFENISDLNGIAIPCMFYESVHPEYKTALYEITKTMLQNTYDSQYIFLKSQVREHMPPECHSTEDYLLSANIYSAVKEKLYSKLTQIVHYSWITEEKRQECIDRMHRWIETGDNKIQIEQEIITANEDEKQFRINEALQGLELDEDCEFRMTARVDAITETTLWELKFVTELSIEHFLQLMIYAWIWMTIYPDNPRQYRLFNIRTNEVYELQTDQHSLTEVMKILLRSKYCAEESEPDENFVTRCRDVFTKDGA
jgi:hypothetical protein